MAKKIEKGLISEGAKVTLYDLENMSLKEMHDAVVMSKGNIIRISNNKQNYG